MLADSGWDVGSLNLLANKSFPRSSHFKIAIDLHKVHLAIQLIDTNSSRSRLSRNLRRFSAGIIGPKLISQRAFVVAPIS